MSTSNRSVKRLWIPAVILVLAGLGIGALWAYPGEMALDGRNFNSLLISALAAILVTAWLLLLSGMRWVVRLSIVAIEIIAAVVILPNVTFTGDIRPVVRWPWEPKADDLVERHRQQQSAATDIVPDLTISLADSPEFRGRKRDGVLTGPKLARDWKAHPPRLLWKQPCGKGWSSFAVAGNMAITLEQRRDSEAAVAYHVETGREIWKYEYPARFAEAMGGIGPRSTPTIADGEVYSLGATGHLACLDGKSGKPKWTANILEGNRNLQWAQAGSPLVVDNLVIVTPGCQNEDDPTDLGVIAYDRASGAKIWSAGNSKGGYASPMLATFAGQRQIVVLEGKRLASYDLTTGKILWNYPWDKTTQDINVAQPLIDEAAGRIFISSGYGVGCAMLAVKNGIEPLWRNEHKPLRCKFSGPIEFQGFIYGLDEGILACISAKDGKLAWKEKRYGHGQLVRCEDLLIILAENGDLALVEANPQEFRELAKIKAINADRTWNVPALANGRIYVRNDTEMACFDLRE